MIVEVKKITSIGIAIVSMIVLSVSKGSFINDTHLTGIICTLFGVLYLFLLYKHFHDINNILVFAFGVLLLLFSNSCGILRAMGVNENDIYIFSLSRFSDQNVNNAVVFNTLCLGLFVVGAICAKRNSSCGLNFVFLKENQYVDRAMKIVGALLFFSFAPFELYFAIRKFIFSQAYGFSYLYSDAFSVGGILGLIERYCILVIPGAFLLSFSNKNSKFKMNMPIVYLLITSGISLLAGDRAEPCGVFIASIWYYSCMEYVNNEKRKRFNHPILLVLLVYVGASLMSFMAEYRTISDRSISGFFVNYLDYFFEFQVVQDVLNETGISIRPLLEIQRYMQSGIIEEANGGSYVGTIIMLIPRGLRSGIYDFAISHNWVELESFITNLVGVDYGLGFSPQAEAYYNFTAYGCLMMVVFGFFITKFLTFDTSKKSNYQYLKFALIPGSFEAMSILTRASSLLLLKYALIYILLPYVLVIVVAGIVSSKRKFL